MPLFFAAGPTSGRMEKVSKSSVLSRCGAMLEPSYAV